MNEKETMFTEAQEGLDDFPQDKEDEKRRYWETMRRFRDQGLLTDEEEEKLFGKNGYYETGKFPQDKKKKWQKFRKEASHTLGKCAAVLLVVCGSIFALSMTSQANRTYVADTVTYLFGNDVVVKENGKNINRDIASENGAYKEIKEQLGIEMPYLQYKPMNLAFEEFIIFKDSDSALINYTIDNNRLAILASKNQEGEAYNGVFEGSPLDVITLEYGVTVQIYKDENKKEKLPTMEAKWMYQGCYYQITANVDEQEFRKIIEKILF